MKKRAVFFYVSVCLLLWGGSIFSNGDYFYELAYDNLLVYQFKQAASVFVLYWIGYFFLQGIRQEFNKRWAALLAMPCGAALWAFTGQILLLLNLPYTMPLTLSMIVAVTALCYMAAKKKGTLNAGSILPDWRMLLFVTGTAFLVSTGWNYINMNYDSYLYFADYGKTMAIAGDYQAWNSSNAFVITNIGQFLPILNSYSAFWGLEYCLPIQSFLVLNMYAVFATAVYERAQNISDRKKRLGYTALFTAALINCTCVVVFANWMLSNAFIMYYITIIGILGFKGNVSRTLDSRVILIGCCLAITLLRKDGIVLVCFLLVCLCCSKALQPKTAAWYLFIPAAAQFYYIGYIRLYLKAQTHTALGTSLLSNKFVLMTVAVVIVTWIYLLLVHKLFERYFGKNIYAVILGLMFAAVVVAIAIKPEASYAHIDAILEVLASPAYGFSVLLWFVLLAIMFTGKVKPDYEMLLVTGYCMLTFLIYWNKGNREQGIDNSGMRTFVQIVPMIFFWASGYVKERWNGRAAEFETDAGKGR